MFTTHVILIVLLFITYSVSVYSQGVPLSPCPRIFWYENDGQAWYGVIEMGPPYQRDLVLKLEMDIGVNLPTSYVGRIELLGQRSQLILDIINRRKIKYQVHFPVLDSIPVVTKIIFNDNEVCSGPRLTARVVTSINLKHVLNTNLDDSNGNPFTERVNQPDEFETQYTRRPIATNNNYDGIYFENKRPSVTVTTSRPGFQMSSLQYRPKPSRTPSPVENDKREPGYVPNTNNPWLSKNTQDSVSSKDTTINSYEQLDQQNIQSPVRESRPNPDTFASFSQRPTPAPSAISNDDKDEVSTICGVPRSVNPLIIGGDSTKKGDWPWLVGIYVKKVSSLNFICGATLVSKDTIITAAHCMLEKNNRPVKREEVIVKLGMFNLQDWTDEDTKTMSVRQIISHPLYDGGLGLRNDIAILKVEKVTFTNYIIPSCLWSEDLDSKSYIGKYGITVGWGRDENGLLASPEPRQARQKLVTLDECRESNVAFVFLTSNTTFCAGERDGTGPCNGDSGGGLYLYVDGRWRLKGIVSSSLNDPTSRNVCDLSYYIIYTDIDKFLDWIKMYM